MISLIFIHERFWKQKKKRKKVKIEIKRDELVDFEDKMSPPVEMMNKISSIEGYDGCDPELVMQKRLLHSDLTPYESRLLTRWGRYNNLDFLTHDELWRMEKFRESRDKDPEDDLRVLLVEPCLEETELSLRKWCSFGNHVEYFLTKGWWSVVERNELKVGDAVQLWKFRRFNQLCFALVIVEIENIESQD